MFARDPLFYEGVRVGSVTRGTTHEVVQSRVTQSRVNPTFSFLFHRKILNELADTPSITITKIEEESNSSQTSQDDAEASEAATNLSTNTVGE